MGSAIPPRSVTLPRFLTSSLRVSVVVLATLAGRHATAQIDLTDEGFRSGLRARYVGKKGSQAERIDERISFVWEARSPDPRIAAKSFHVTWSGYLMTQLPGKYTLSVYAVGRVRIKLAGNLILDERAETPTWMQADPVELPFDWHPLEVAYDKKGNAARLSLFWEGPGFQREPISERWFYHDLEKSIPADFQRGEELVRALRCSACHTVPARDTTLMGPALDKIAGNISQRWLVDWLTGDGAGRDDETTGRHRKPTSRRMPHFGLSRDDAENVAKYLVHQSRPQRTSKPADSPLNFTPDPHTGRRLLMTIGCLACHPMEGLGTRGTFDGGDLTYIADKRPKDFFAVWLADPSKLNRRHRMPVFDLTTKERHNLAAFLATCKTKDATEFTGPIVTDRDPGVAAGRRLFAKYRCFACHESTDDSLERLPMNRTAITHSADWSRACIADTGQVVAQPRFQLDQQSRAAVRLYIETVPASETPTASQVLVENNCLSCHARGAAEGLAPRVLEIAQTHSEFESIVPAMVPPSLNSVGDKLKDAALTNAIRRTTAAHRPWLLVRMPKFAMPDDDLQHLVQHFSHVDRIPDDADRPHPPELNEEELVLAGMRLVTTEGFGCTSCHQIGNVAPPDAPLNARGPNLSQLGQRIRRPWYDRWVRDPARIVPKMEMPSVQLAVKGILNDNLDEQLAAVWHVVNQPGFQPPMPNPVRIVRRSGLADRNETAAVLTDVIQMQERTFVKPLVIGLKNRHSVLLDLEANRLAGWWIGDVARQRTEGKSWLWEAAGAELLAADSRASELTLELGGKVCEPSRAGQFATEADQWRHSDTGVEFQHRLRFRRSGELSGGAITLGLVQTIHAFQREESSGFVRTMNIRGVPDDAQVNINVVEPSKLAAASTGAESRSIALSSRSRIVLVAPDSATFNDVGALRLGKPLSGGDVTLTLRYETTLPVDQFPVESPTLLPPPAEQLDVIPGFEVTRLPIADQWMPTGIAWRGDGTLVVTSLKGRVWLARDSDGDGLEDTTWPFSDDLAAPFGASASGDHIDVINKYALLRMFDDNGDGRVDRTITLASGWGHTTDYHDWTVGLPRDGRGNYFVATSCQQDDRSPAGAYLRGKVLRLSPRTPSLEDPRLFRTDEISGGHRFPMGIAVAQDGGLFVTDNQGNYNPFNELNHVQQGARYGFINALERKSDLKSTLTPPAINLPHPWTRSVNGICFLETPRDLKQQDGRAVFGAFEGHLIGCEYDTRRLIRMSLQRVGDTYQGAAYPFSYSQPLSGPPLLGPLACAVAPDGDLYVGSIRDSGWGGANNIGTLVRIKSPENELPPGIAEVRARPDGFEIRFTRDLDWTRALDKSNYSVSSYTRDSTPAYGGSDVGRRAEPIRKIEMSAETQSIRIRLDELRAGYVYEFQLKNLTAQQGIFFPAEAFYTLNQIPD